MTTSDKTLEEVQSDIIDVEKPKQRSVSELLIILEQDDTFQGMTDAEIKSIIQYEKQLSEMEGNIKRLNKKNEDYHSEMIKQTSESLQKQEAMLQSIIDRASNLQLKVVQYG